MRGHVDVGAADHHRRPPRLGLGGQQRRDGDRAERGRFDERRPVNPAGDRCPGRTTSARLGMVADSGSAARAGRAYTPPPGSGLPKTRPESAPSVKVTAPAMSPYQT